MPLTMVSDILIRDIPNPARLRDAMARAFGIPDRLINVRTVGDLAPVDASSRVQLVRQPEPVPGDFRDIYSFSVAEDLVARVDDVLGVVAQTLGLAIATEGRGEHELVLHLPDGSRQEVELVEDEDEGLRFTAEVQRLIDDATQSLRRAIAS